MSSTIATGADTMPPTAAGVIKPPIGFGTTPTGTAVGIPERHIKPAVGFGAVTLKRTSRECEAVPKVLAWMELNAEKKADEKRKWEEELAALPASKSKSKSAKRRPTPAKSPTPTPAPTVTPSLSETAAATTNPACPPNTALHNWLRSENARLIKAYEKQVESQRARNATYDTSLKRLQDRIDALEKKNDAVNERLDARPATMFTAPFSRNRPIQFAPVEDTKPTPDFIRPNTVPSLFVYKADWQTKKGWDEKQDGKEESGEGDKGEVMDKVDEDDKGDEGDKSDERNEGDEGDDGDQGVVEDTVESEGTGDLIDVDDEDEEDPGWLATSPRGGD